MSASERYEQGLEIRRDVLGADYVERSEEIREVLLRAAVYAGVPVGVDAFPVAREVLAEAAAER